jgi:hypothetical protein
MNVTITQKSSGKAMEMVWRPESGKAYSNTACSFLYNLPRAARADFKVEFEGRIVTKAAHAAASEEMNAIRNGRAIPALPQF